MILFFKKRYFEFKSSIDIRICFITTFILKVEYRFIVERLADRRGKTGEGSPRRLPQSGRVGWAAAKALCRTCNE